MRLLSLFCLMTFSFLYADDTSHSKTIQEPPKEGNFSLPISQQPAALVGLGGNIIDAGEIQLYFFADDFLGKKRITSDAIPGILFGVTKDFTLFFNFPVAPAMRDGPYHSRGFEDFFVQAEYAFLNKSTKTSSDQATIVGNVTVPTGSIKKKPPTGFGSPSFFLGGTYYHTTVNWVFFTACGAILTTADKRTKFGDQFLYQLGIERYLPSPKGKIYAAMLEFTGQYNQKNRIKGITDPNSGGNIILVTPSVWYSTKNFLFQFGVSLPVNQNLFGQQRKFNYVLNLNLAWSY